MREHAYYSSMNKHMGKDMTVSELAETVSGLTGTVSELAETVSGLVETVSELAGIVSKLTGTVSGLTGTVSGLVETVSELAGIVSKLAEKMDAEFASLRKEMRQGFEVMDRKIDSVEENFAAKVQFEIGKLEDRTFSPEEKEDIINTVRVINKQWEEDETGARHITLTRKEYDAASQAQGFPSRFAGVPMEVE